MSDISYLSLTAVILTTLKKIFRENPRVEKNRFGIFDFLSYFE